MDSFTGPGQQSISNFGRAISGLGAAIYDKLNSAEISAQYYSGVEALRRGLIDFNNQLLQEPDYQKYPDLSATAQDQLWGQVEKNTTNQQALNQLSIAWEQMKTGQLDAMYAQQNKRRIADMFAKTSATVDTIWQTEADPEIAKQKTDAILKPAVDSGVMNPDPVNNYQTQQYFNAKIRKLSADGNSLFQSYDGDSLSKLSAAEDYVLDPANSPGLPASSRWDVVDSLEKTAQKAEATKLAVAKKTNTGLSSDIWNRLYKNGEDPLAVQSIVLQNQYQDAGEGHSATDEQNKDLSLISMKINNGFHSDTIDRLYVAGETPDAVRAIVKANPYQDEGSVSSGEQRLKDLKLIDDFQADPTKYSILKQKAEQQLGTLYSKYILAQDYSSDNQFEYRSRAAKVPYITQSQLTSFSNGLDVGLTSEQTRYLSTYNALSGDSPETANAKRNIQSQIGYYLATAGKVDEKQLSAEVNRIIDNVVSPALRKAFEPILYKQNPTEVTAAEPNLWQKILNRPAVANPADIADLQFLSTGEGWTALNKHNDDRARKIIQGYTSAAEANLKEHFKPDADLLAIPEKTMPKPITVKGQSLYPVSQFVNRKDDQIYNLMFIGKSFEWYTAPRVNPTKWTLVQPNK